MFSWAHLGLVVLGGALGTALRAGLGLASDAFAGPLFVPVVNVLGAFALGALTGVLLARGETASTRMLRAFLGTGLLGGFTTYSALAVESVGTPAALALGAASAIVGTGAAWLGLVLAQPRRARS